MRAFTSRAPFSTAFGLNNRVIFHCELYSFFQAHPLAVLGCVFRRLLLLRHVDVRVCVYLQRIQPTLLLHVAGDGFVQPFGVTVVVTLPWFVLRPCCPCHGLSSFLSLPGIGLSCRRQRPLSFLSRRHGCCSIRGA